MLELQRSRLLINQNKGGESPPKGKTKMTIAETYNQIEQEKQYFASVLNTTLAARGKPLDLDTAGGYHEAFTIVWDECESQMSVSSGHAIYSNEEITLMLRLIAAEQNTNHAIAVQRVENLRNKVEAVEAARDEALAKVEALKAEIDSLFT